MNDEQVVFRVKSAADKIYQVTTGKPLRKRSVVTNDSHDRLILKTYQPYVDIDFSKISQKQNPAVARPVNMGHSLLTSQKTVPNFAGLPGLLSRAKRMTDKFCADPFKLIRSRNSMTRATL